MNEKNFKELGRVVEHPQHLTPEDKAAQAAWEEPAKQRRAERAAALDVQRSKLHRELVLWQTSVNAAFEQGDPVLLEAAQEETLRILDIIRLTIRSR